eukprot:Rmarinus@m.2105
MSKRRVWRPQSTSSGLPSTMRSSRARSARLVCSVQTTTMIMMMTTTLPSTTATVRATRLSLLDLVVRGAPGAPSAAGAAKAGPSAKQTTLNADRRRPARPRAGCAGNNSSNRRRPVKTPRAPSTLGLLPIQRG